MLYASENAHQYGGEGEQDFQDNLIARILLI